MEWKLISDIPGYEVYTRYELNITGDLRNRKTDRILKWRVTKGYYMTYLNHNGAKKNISQHVAICMLFKPNPFNKPYVDHKNRKRSDNSFDNLRWVTHAENMQNRSISSRNTSGEMNICSITNHGKPVWKICIMSRAREHTAFFPRDPVSDVIPQDVIARRDEMKILYHLEPT